MASQARTRTPDEIDEAFAAKIQIVEGPLPTPCWIWQGARRADGYGVRTVRRKIVACHRWAFERMIAPIPDGMFCCHICDNRACANPYHVFLGDWKANARDALDKGRLRIGERHPYAKLTESQVGYVRSCRLSRNAKGLAAELGVSQKTIHDIWNRRSWKHLVP